MTIMRGISMHKVEHDIKAIMYPANGTHHRLCTIRGNTIQLTQNPSEWSQRQDQESVQTTPSNPANTHM